MPLVSSVHQSSPKLNSKQNVCVDLASLLPQLNPLILTVPVRLISFGPNFHSYIAGVNRDLSYVTEQLSLLIHYAHTKFILLFLFSCCSLYITIIC